MSAIRAATGSYPKQVVLADKSFATIRLMTSDDEEALLDFFRRIPEEDRFYLKDEVTSPQVIKGWVQTLDYHRVIPLLAVTDGQIIADGTLHRRRAGARRHTGEIRVVVDPEYRNIGLGRVIILELIAVAQELELEKLSFEIVRDREEVALRTAQNVGFTTLATFPGYARDITGETHDLLILELAMNEWGETPEF